MLVFASIIPLTFMITACQDQLFHENIVTNAEEPAKPNGGMAAFYEHVGKEIRYPLEAREKGIDGKVFVEFVVNSNGSVDVTGISGIGTGCDLEAMRVVQSSPKWIPAKDNGVPVRQKLVLPISFKLVGSTTKDESKAPSGSLHEVVVVSYIPGALNIYE